MSSSAPLSRPSMCVAQRRRSKSASKSAPNSSSYRIVRQDKEPVLREGSVDVKDRHVIIVDHHLIDGLFAVPEPRLRHGFLAQALGEHLCRVWFVFNQENPHRLSVAITERGPCLLSCQSGGSW